MTKHTIMRKLLPLLLFVAFASSCYAQGVSFTVVTQPCNNNGILKAYFTGVTPPLTVVWTTQGSTGMPITHTGVSSLNDVLTSWSGGPLTVVATDSNGASDVGTALGSPPFTYNLYDRPAVCPVVDTAIDSVHGGTYPYTTQWYNMATTAVVASGDPAYLAEGNFGVIITDAAGCVYGSKVDPSYLNLTSTPSFTIGTVSTTAACTNGTASVTVTSGTAVPTLSYQWSNGATTPNLSNLVTGTYTVTMSDALGCKATGTVFVPQSVSIIVPVVPTAASCLDTNGKVTAFGSGGVPPYAYLWSNGATTQSQTGLPAGKYYVDVTDANGCIGNDSGTIAVSTPISVTYSSSPSLCTSASGNSTLNVSGGTGPYTIDWYTTPAQYGYTATHLWAGDYYFHVTDGVGCVQSGYAVVPPIDVISLSFSSVAALCTLSNGSMNVVPTGGVAPYSYLWSNGATTSGISGVQGGNYQLTVTDNLGCKVSTDPYVPIYSPISVGVLSTPASCIFTNDGMNTATAYGGTPPYTYAWSSGGTTSTISALPYGAYYVSVADAAGCTTGIYYSYVGYNTAATNCYSVIQGTVYDDMNGNCVQDIGEPGIPNIQIAISGRGYTYTDANGNYSYEVPSGTYTVSETVLAFYPLAACQSNSLTVTTVAGTGGPYTLNFANSIDTIHDMHITTWDYYLSNPVPGHSYTQAVIVSNDGTVTEPAVNTVYNTDGQIFAPSFMPTSVFTPLSVPNSYSTLGAFPTINPGASQQFLMTYNVPTNIPIGTNVVFRDTVVYDTFTSHWTSDYSPWNNVNYFTTTVAAAYDPNFKEVNPKGTGPTGLIPYTDSVLEYMVHFQNTGTWPAENVVVIDTLDDNLNWTSLRPEYMSAACKVTMQQVGAKKVVTFTFKDINLPTEKTSLLYSNGMLTYTIHIKPGMPVGTQFKNHASIYFDFNQPIVTNTTVNTLQTAAPSAVNNVTTASANTFTIYPNPASQSFNSIINTDNAGKAIMVVSDVAGKELITKTFTLQAGQQTITTDASQLAPGMYFVTFSQQGKSQTQKLVIIK